MIPDDLLQKFLSLFKTDFRRFFDRKVFSPELISLLKKNFVTFYKRKELISLLKKNFVTFCKRKAREMLPCLIIDPIDWEQDLPNLYITEMIMPDEIDLDTDEDRMGTIKEDDKIVKRIDTLGGTPDCLQIVDEAMWAQFLPPASTACNGNDVRQLVPTEACKRAN
ncbi:hypothetical protein Tcan_03984 [Toxocara canis]|uniref:Uncharacterized protein n=1 Tax=Toxocara canis TaxID=6265 RepID=A0A0B2VL78_TOXCA|nr:hypothetical protein Tcan_03984 [Toxocara canis]